MESINVLRDSLIDLPRKELQAKAKAIGIAANLKTSEIIELILQHSHKVKGPDQGGTSSHNNESLPHLTNDTSFQCQESSSHMVPHHSKT